jgi:RIO-like serine/threonine protein kinase
MVRPSLSVLTISQPKFSRYFNRDVECIRTFFKRRFRYESALYPRFRKTVEESGKESGFKLDVMVEASGFGHKEMKVLEEVILISRHLVVNCLLTLFHSIWVL